MTADTSPYPCTCQADWETHGYGGPAQEPSETCPQHGRRAAEVEVHNDMRLEWSTDRPGSFAEAIVRSDWVALSASIAGLHDHLVASIREAAQRFRDERDGDHPDSPLTVGEMAEITRKLALIQDICGKFERAFKAGGRAALDEVVLDAERTGLKRVEVPLSPGGPQVTAARASVKTTTFDDAGLFAVIAEVVVAQHGDHVVPLDPSGDTAADMQRMYETGLRRGAKEGAVITTQMRSKGSWLITAVESLAKQLIAAGFDQVATALAKAKHVSWEDGRWTVKVEQQ